MAMRRIYRLGQYRVVAAVAVLGAALLAIPAFGQSDDPSCGKIEGSRIGRDTTVEAGSITVTLHRWKAKDGEPDEFVGFDYRVDGGSLTVITAKAGPEIHEVDAFGSAGTWRVPDTVEGSDEPIKAVSNVVVCAAKRSGSGGAE